MPRKFKKEIKEKLYEKEHNENLLEAEKEENDECLRKLVRILNNKEKTVFMIVIILITME